MSFYKLASVLLLSLCTSLSFGQMSGSALQAIINSTPAGGTVYLPAEVDTLQTLVVNKPLVFTPVSGAAKIYGSVKVTATQITSNDPNYSRLDPTVVQNVQVIDLNQFAINPGQIVFPSIENAAGSTTGLLELEEDDAPLSLTRYPATGFLQCNNVSQSIYIQSPIGFPTTWSNQNQTGLNNYITYGYFQSGETEEEQMPSKITSPSGGIEMIRTDFARPYGALQNYSRFAMQNILEELKIPGQYYIDYNLNRAYFIPLQSNYQTLRISLSSGAIMSLVSGASGTQFSGDITLQDGRSDGLDGVPGLYNIGIYGLTVKNVYGYGINLPSITDSQLMSITVEHTGNTGVIIGGGDKTSLTSSNIEMCFFLIDDTCRIFRTNAGALQVWGVGEFVHHGTIRNSPNQAIEVYGNNMTFLALTIDGAAQEAGDVGAVYAGRSMIEWGNTFTNLTIQNIPPMLQTTKPGSSGIRYGIYLDDQFSGASIMNLTGNNTNCLVYLGGGVFNTVQNVYANNCTESPVQMDDRGENYQSSAWSTLFLPEYSVASALTAYSSYGWIFEVLGSVESLEPGAPQYCAIHNVQITNSPGVTQRYYDGAFKNPNGFVTYVYQN